MIKTAMRKLARDESGATAIEYGLIVAMIALSCVVAFSRLGGASSGGLQGTVDKISTALK